ncbi:Eukaryotic translation initiation factor eIF-1 [Serendipita sp. 396]|nr:Eukaryotic translation initiation factor eIF-1 [Serendipita sp. 396]KAG8786815.1 Eukaryotic translation initiation factor eIF-1 [Serendipita sp. 397]KAG8799200.1 Eukaryotic translation initiation factor eIF-1 [Serendipita sp. 398]KAG8807557.1 Eukaryotic translation initiation factor eIF-1 [Serendipita sp. 401]KAG8833441.1 Eukaryotic translation initiation factor eIF-1 [Serendipita sp. 400]KAG8866112.1 Eukaryotic translation initiation factor eIF-1 [Serendipita sp. 405]
MSVQNLANQADPFDPEDDEFEQSDSTKENYIHIRIQQRNGRKTLTTLQGLGKEYDHKKILKEFKKLFACNGSLAEDETLGPVIQLQGDQRSKILTFLTEQGISKETIKLHGF